MVAVPAAPGATCVAPPPARVASPDAGLPLPPGAPASPPDDDVCPEPPPPPATAIYDPIVPLVKYQNTLAAVPPPAPAVVVPTAPVAPGPFCTPTANKSPTFTTNVTKNEAPLPPGRNPVVEYPPGAPATSAVTDAPHAREGASPYATPTASGDGVATTDSGTTDSTGVAEGGMYVAVDEGDDVGVREEVTVDEVVAVGVFVLLGVAVLVRDDVLVADAAAVDETVMLTEAEELGDSPAGRVADGLAVVLGDPDAEGVHDAITTDTMDA